MNHQQEEALEIALSGHNLALLGQAGVGKTFTVRSIRNELTAKGHHVAVTCTTGIACANYENAMTIHRFCGVKDGRHSIQELQDVLQDDDTISGRLCQTDVLIIDEISMLSYKMLCDVEAVCRMARKSQQMFGGLQVIVSGDFFQLAPVPNALYDDRGDFAFSGPLWNDAFPHQLVLTEVVRQSDPRLIKAIRETSHGILSDETVNFLEGLSRPLSGDTMDTVKIFATNQQVDIHNQRALMSLPGDLRMFPSDDWGGKKCMYRITAPKSLWVKEGCKVMLLRNLSDLLVNGTIGVVTKIREDYIDVDFPKTSARIEKYTFGVYDPRLKKNIATRMQFPLKLCYSLTVHKSQGMTIDRLEIDCDGMFRAGQLGVAIGRARTVAGLRLINFDRRSVMPQDDTIFEVCERNSLPLMDDFECCHHDSIADEDRLAAVADGPTDVFDPDDDDFLLEAFEEAEGALWLEDSDNEDIEIVFDQEEILSILESVKPKHCITDMQKNVLKKIELVEKTPEKLAVFCSKAKSVISQHFAQTFDISKSKDKVNNFYELSHKHLISSKYKRSVEELFGTVGEEQFQISYCLFEHIREHFLKEKSQMTAAPGEEDVNPRTSTEMNDASRSKVRYVSGYCFRKIREKYSTSLGNNLFKQQSKSIEIVEESSRKKSLITSCIRGQKQILEDTTDMSSLSEILRKQNLREGLINISDKAFKFSVELCQLCLQLQSEENIHRYGKHFHYFVSTSLKENNELFNKWLNAFEKPPVEIQNVTTTDPVKDSVKKLVNYSSDIIELFHEYVELFTRVMTKQFVHDVLEKWDTKKKEAHRKDIKISKTKDSNQGENSTGRASGRGETSRGRARASGRGETSRGRGKGRGETSRGRGKGRGETSRGRGKGRGETSRGRGKGRGETSSGRGKGRGETSSGRGKGRGETSSGRGATSSGRGETSSGRGATSRGRGKGKGKSKGKSAGPTLYPCGICRENCFSDCVQCDLCDKWFHGMCVHVDLGSLPEEWFCPDCE